MKRKNKKTQPACDVLGMSPEGTLNVQDLQGTLREPTQKLMI